MIKMLIAFISLFVIFFVGIDLFRKFTNRQKWEFVKIAGYSSLISILVIVVLVFIVILF